MRDFPQEKYELLCQSAKDNGRSINQQLKFIVTEYLRTAFDSSTLKPTSTDPAANASTAPATMATPITSSSVTAAMSPAPAASAAAIEARKAKRKALFARIDSRTYPTFSPSMDAATVVSRMRAER